MVVDLNVDLPSKRADLFLVTKLNLSRNQIQKLIEQNHLLLNGAPFKPSVSLKKGDRITGSLPEEKEESFLEPVNLPITILYEDEHIIVVNKEKGMVVHPAHGHKNDTLVNAILSHCKDLKGVGGVLRPGVVHRLDKDTSGVIVFAKDEESYKELQRQFKAREVKKRYLVIVLGCPVKTEDTIVSNISRSTKDRKKFTVSKDGKEAITFYKTIKSAGGVSLLEASIKTGRTHQIRVHMEHIGTPVLGDPCYNKKNYKNFIKDPLLLEAVSTLKGQALFAEYLEFKHPVTGKIIGFHGIMPEDMKNIIKRLDTDATDKQT